MLGLWWAYGMGRRRARRDMDRHIDTLERRIDELEHHDDGDADMTPHEPDIFEVLWSLITIVGWIAVFVFVIVTNR